MCQAAITCKPKDQEDPFTLQPRNGDVDHYLRLFSYTDPETGETQLPPSELAVETLEAIDTPNPEFEQLQKEFEEGYCGTKFGKAASGEDGSAVNWIPLGQQQPKWNPETDKVPSNPSWEAGDSEANLEQLAEAGSLAYAGMKLKAAANSIVDNAVPRLLHNPSEPDAEAMKARKKRHTRGRRRDMAKK